MNILGIDPGLKGSLVILSSDSKAILLTQSMPIIGREIDIARLVNLLKGQKPNIDIAYLELAGSRPGQSVSSTSNLRRTLEIWKPSSLGFEFPIELSLPLLGPKQFTKVSD